ncbi:MAG: iron-containing redox enzyme family protein [Gammaproteobacteria bacterium]|nr:iron-containing redox enzyme family protein [Gammaproteobacteria bacterium]MBQ0838811.1 iron-containing redox enzyme family protein [Gammaproteobacteria bacterium]
MMGFYDSLRQATQTDQQYLMAAPIFTRMFSGDICKEDYAAFLSQAYQHVKHTVPLLMAVGSRLPDDKGWLLKAVAEYIEEEFGHEQWILDDINAAGFDAEKARLKAPNLATELLVAYAYDSVQRVNPLAFFGMVHVLEGTSINIADAAASVIQTSLQLPDNAFSYLRSHGALDIEHVKLFAGLMDQISDPEEQAQIIHSAQVFYRLYGDMFRSLDPEQGRAIA